MLGTRFDTMGGISSVVNVYRTAGLFDRWPVKYIPTHCDGTTLDKFAIAISAFIRFIVLAIKGNVGIVHIHVSSRASFWRKFGFFVFARIVGAKTIVHLHSGRFHIFYEKECGVFAKRLIRYVFDKADRVIVLSHGWRSWLQSISANDSILAIYNPVAVPSLDGFEKRDRNNVLSLGRLGKAKGSYDLVDAVAGLIQDFPVLQVTLAGDGDVTGILNHAQFRRVMGHVCAPGWITGAAKESLLQAASIYCLPSYNEGLPMSVLEAMAYGIPVISTPVGGIPEAITDGIEGYLVAPGDRVALEAKLRLLLADHRIAQKLGADARVKVEKNFSVEAVLPKIESIYRELGVMAR